MVRYGTHIEEEEDEDPSYDENSDHANNLAMVIYEEERKKLSSPLSSRRRRHRNLNHSNVFVSSSLLKGGEGLCDESLSNNYPSSQQHNSIISKRGWFVVTIMVMCVSYLARQIDLQPRYAMKMVHSMTGLGSGKQKCPLSIRHLRNKSENRKDWSHSPVEEYLLQRGIIGQDPAVSVIAKEIETWMNEGIYSYGQKPLWMVMVGRDGVGKSFAVEELSQLLFHNCRSDLKQVSGLLTIEGSSYSIGSDTSENYIDTIGDISNTRQPIIFQIIEHVSAQGEGNGAIIVINDFDQINPTILKSTMESLSVVSKDAEISLYDNESRSTVKVDFSSTLFLFTTKKFTSNILQELFVSEGKKTGVRVSILQEALKEEFEGSLQHTAFSFFGSIVPFFPLYIEDLFLILKSKLDRESKKFNSNQWKRLLVTDEAITYFISSIEIYKLSNPRFLFTPHIVGRGGHELRSIFKNLWKYIFDNFDEPRPHQIAMLDYMPNTTRIHFSWCKDEIDVNDYNDSYKEQEYAHHNSACEDIWSGYLMN